MKDAAAERIDFLIGRMAELDNDFSVRIYLQGALTTAVNADARQQIADLIKQLPEEEARARIHTLMRPGIAL